MTGWLLAAIALLVWTAGYVTACWYWPFTACKKCEGGKRRSPSGKAWRSCPRCTGTGRRMRTGRRLWIALRR